MPYDQGMIDQIKQRAVDTSLDSLPSPADIAKHIKWLNNGKSPGDNGIPARAEAYKALANDRDTLILVSEVIWDF